MQNILDEITRRTKKSVYEWVCLEKCVSKLSDNSAIACLIYLVLNPGNAVKARFQP